jgi:hypothetical protein
MSLIGLPGFLPPGYRRTVCIPPFQLLRNVPTLVGSFDLALTFGTSAAKGWYTVPDSATTEVTVLPIEREEVDCWLFRLRAFASGVPLGFDHIFTATQPPGPMARHQQAPGGVVGLVYVIELVKLARAPRPR